MEITQEIKDIHRQLSNTNQRFLEYVEKNPGCLEQANFPMPTLDIDFLALQAWPTLINKKFKKGMEDAGSSVVKLIK
ncbi:MAG: hypothetical protein GY940_26175, partial [bacterium]|nr:hypothetical protein [bacterium]